MQSSSSGAFWRNAQSETRRSFARGERRSAHLCRSIDNLQLLQLYGLRSYIDLWLAARDNEVTCAGLSPCLERMPTLGAPINLGRSLHDLCGKSDKLLSR
jgi:hypothetical protein